MRGRDVQAGDHVELSGSYSGATFVASTIRFTDDSGTTIEQGPATAVPDNIPADLGVVTIYGTVSQTLADGPQLVLRDTQNNNRMVRVYALDDLPMRTKAGTYTTAVQLKDERFGRDQGVSRHGRKLHRADDSDSVICVAQADNALSHNYLE